MPTAAPNIFDVNAAPQVGARATESAHRKVELQAPADLTYLIANATRAAREKLDTHFPPEAAVTTPGGGGGREGGAGVVGKDAKQGEDVMRRRVEELVDEYIRNTFSAAKDSIAINGMDSQELEAELAKIQEGEELEPFDAKLAQHVQALAAQIEHETLHMATLRRREPQATAQRFVQNFDAQAQAFDAQLKDAAAARVATARATSIAVDGAAAGGEPVDPERQEEMQRAFRRGVEDLNTVKTGMGGTVAKLERAREAVEVVEDK